MPHLKQFQTNFPMGRKTNETCKHMHTLQIFCLFPLVVQQGPIYLVCGHVLIPTLKHGYLSTHVRFEKLDFEFMFHVRFFLVGS